MDGVVKRPFMDQEAIKGIIPHREPFLLVDDVLEMEPGASIKAVFYAAPDKDFFRGHFPGNPVMPGVLQLEALAQAGAVLILSMEGYAGKLALFGGIEKARFRRQVKPGDALVLEAEITRLSARGGKAKGRTSVDGETACEAEIMFVLGDRGA